MYIMSDFFTKSPFSFSISYDTQTAAGLQLYREKFGLTDLKFSYLHTKKLAIYREQKLSNYSSAAIQGPNWAKLAKKCTLYTNGLFNLYSV